MQFFSALSQSIFLRIYIGLLVVCILVVCFAQLLISSINAERAQTYREDMATAAAYLVTEGLNRQIDAQHRNEWLSDASNLFDAHFELLPVQMANDAASFKTSETKRLNKNQAVVRYDSERYTDIYYRVMENSHILLIHLDKISEQQIKGLGVLFMDDLVNYPTLEAKQQRLDQLQPHFPFSLKLSTMDKLDLDTEQQARLYRKDVVVVFHDSSSMQSSSIKIIAPIESGNVLVLGPIGLFNWFPLNLLVSVILLSMFLISLGVYALIFPLERKLQLIQTGVNKVKEGKLDTKVKVLGVDEIAHLAMTFNNMTEHIRRLIESQRELTRAVSHELRTPVARIRFGIDMLADTEDEESRLMQRDYIDQDIEALNGLIDEILTYAKLEEGSPKLDFEPVNLHDLVLQVVRETNALGKHAKAYNAPIDKDIVAEADKRYLHRVLQNLAGNAIRYAETQIIISAGIEKSEAYICVEDDGQGIPEKDREKVFIPFARLDDSRTRASGGYGLGLSIVSRIAFWFNGEMYVDESPTLGGARFMMRWPLQQIGKTISANNLTQQNTEQKPTPSSSLR